MSTNCLDTDTLVSVATALEWDVPARLDHLAGCERCRAGLAGVAELREELMAAPPLEAAQVVKLPAAAPGSTAVAGTTGVAPRRRAHTLIAAATFLAAGATAFLLVLLLAGGLGAPLGLVVAAAAGLASVLPARVPWHKQEA